VLNRAVVIAFESRTRFVIDLVVSTPLCCTIVSFLSCTRWYDLATYPRWEIRPDSAFGILLTGILFLKSLLERAGMPLRFTSKLFAIGHITDMVLGGMLICGFFLQLMARPCNPTRSPLDALSGTVYANWFEADGVALQFASKRSNAQHNVKCECNN